MGVAEGLPGRGDWGRLDGMETESLSFRRFDEGVMEAAAREFAERMVRRRSVRSFSSEAVPRRVIEEALRAAGSAPSGANLQPWHFAVVESPDLKRRLREAAEAEERSFYDERAPAEWLETLAPLGTDEQKPFLEKAPVLIAVFSKNRVQGPRGEQKTYYPRESVGIAVGLLIAGLHLAGLATLTHTPSPMGFLNDLLGRPVSEKPFLLLVVGYPEEGCRVPRIRRHPVEAIASWHRA